eukprot:TRINITY_DN66396_c9_g1_i2.p1 TRINITY_DN66396_c9_g1~~TRINITY_DN66396_c9_g1_i2.p1  ORF type:complete len:351 (+),score=202.75 TRINITY_DN66396_c9_g1_i2:24-1076(+)
MTMMMKMFKMRSVVVAVAVAATMCVVATQAAVDSPVPFMIWSSGAHFADPGRSAEPHVVDNRLTSLDDVSKLLQPLMNHKDDNNNGNGNNNAEMMVAFVNSRMSSATMSRRVGAFAASGHASGMLHLQESVQTARSSLMVPFVETSKQSGKVSDELLAIVRRAGGQVTAAEVGASDASDVQNNESGCEALLSHLGDLDAGVWSNGVTDLVLVSFRNPDNVDEQDECINKVMREVRQRSGNKYLALYTADESDERLRLSLTGTADDADADAALLDEPTPVFFLETASLLGVGVGAATNSTVGPTHISSPILFGLMFGFFFLFTLLCGTSCMMSIQTPLRFPSRRVAINKEY